MKALPAKGALPAPPRADPDAMLLPHNLEAERSLLGVALVDAKAAEWMVETVSPTLFFRRAHQDIARAMGTLIDRKVEVDFITLKEELTRTKKLEEVGGPAYISSLADGIPRGTNVKYYAGIVRDLAKKRNLVMFAQTTIDFVVANEHQADTILADTDRRLLELQKGHVEGRMAPLKDSLHGLFADLEWRTQHRGELTGLETGFAGINELTFGWQEADLIIVAARPSIGKTTLVMNSAVLASQATDARVAIFSLEMRRKQLEYRILSQLSGIPLTRILSGHLGSEDYKALAPALEAMRDLKIEIDDKSGLTALDIRYTCRRLRSEGGLNLIVVDYLQLMPGTLERRGATRNEEMTDIANRLKDLADEMSCPIIALSQLRRTEGRPKLEDLRESGALEQVADVVALLHRKDHRASGKTECILAKQRNGPTGTVYLDIDRDTTTFRDSADQEPEPEPEKPRRRGGRRGSSPQPDLINE